MVGDQFLLVFTRRWWFGTNCCCHLEGFGGLGPLVAVIYKALIVWDHMLLYLNGFGWLGQGFGVIYKSLAVQYKYRLLFKMFPTHDKRKPSAKQPRQPNSMTWEAFNANFN